MAVDTGKQKAGEEEKWREAAKFCTAAATPTHAEPSGAEEGKEQGGLSLAALCSLVCVCRGLGRSDII